MNTNYIVGIVTVLIVGFGAYAFFSRPAQAPDTETSGMAATTTNTTVSSIPSSDSSTTGTGASVGVGVSVGTPTIVTYTSTGFSPKTVTIKKGQSVIFVNKSGHSMWIGSDDHPAHTKYAGTERKAHCPDTTGTAFDQCGVGDSYTFTFQQTGSWGYHNHTGAEDAGMVIVQ
ncbi:MAG: plastocyanin/azurin family copper-binding protein [Minisyncoccia bacterium]